MIRLLALTPVILLVLLTSCFSYKEFPVESDYSYSGDFRRYKTFNFLDTRSSGEDSTIQNEIIERAVRARMELQGYEFSERAPRLLISYKIFYDSLDFTGYEQPELELFVKYENYVEQDMNPVDYKLKQGTLLVLMYDRELKKSIWQGYASGVFGAGFYQDKRVLQGAVRSIFDKYRVFAEDFYKRQIRKKKKNKVSFR